MCRVGQVVGLTIREMKAAAPRAARAVRPTVTDADGWTVRTHNRCLAAHYEHTVVITRGKPKVLTAVG